MLTALRGRRTVLTMPVSSNLHEMMGGIGGELRSVGERAVLRHMTRRRANRWGVAQPKREHVWIKRFGVA